MIKFIAGPTMGPALGFTWIETVVVTILGMMTSVIIFTFFGKRIRAWYLKRKGGKKPKLFTRRNRRFVSVWKKYGIAGVAFFTPIIFTPIGGALLVSSLGGGVRKTLLYMLLSAIVWSAAMSTLFHLAINQTV
ncbi:MAG: small multi-drug export protein [Cyclobacteriaceae bacterium]